MLSSDNFKRLLSILADGQFHSGTELAGLLGLSRTSIWKHLQSFTTFGLEVNAVSGKGYKLQSALELLDAERIEPLLSSETHALIGSLEIHQQLDSTNTYLMNTARQLPAKASVCLAEHQTAGKGRRGRTWVSPLGHNIYLSLLWHYQDGPGAINGLSLAVGVAVVKALRGIGVADVALKWPNDIHWRGRKLAGILIEVSGESNGPSHAVIGLGLNVYLPQIQAEGIEQAWVDLQQILSGKLTPFRNRLVATLLNEMVPVVAAYQAKFLPQHVAQWRLYDGMMNREVSLYIGSQKIDGVVKGIDDQGLLLLMDRTGRLRSFASGEVSFRCA